MNVHAKEFKRRRTHLSYPELRFDATADLSQAEPPPLSYNLNEEFLKHQLWVTNLVIKLDNLTTHSDRALREERKALIMEVQAHEVFLDSIVESAWEKMKMKGGQKDCDAPEYIDCCKHTFPTSVRH